MFEENVTVKKITDWDLVVDMARFTINKDDINKIPSDNFKNHILRAEHSPIRCLLFLIEMRNIPCWVSQHIARHDAFAFHTVREGASDTHFVGTSRSDRTGISRDKLPQDAPVNHRIFLNAQDLITISRRRLCRLASSETRQLWETIKEKVALIDPCVAQAMVPNCVYCGRCPEISCCGYINSPNFKEKLEEYQNFNRFVD